MWGGLASLAGLAAWPGRSDAGPTVPSAKPKAASSAAPGATGTQGSCPSGMWSIAAGTYQMGSNGGDADEKPVHATTVGAFCMEQTEVTVRAYAACVSAGRCTAADTGGFCNAGATGRDEHPINCVDWDQATAYCAWKGWRLPTEEEWEYAARGTDGRTYPWGNGGPGAQLCWDGEGNSAGKGNRRSTCVVGSFKAGVSPFGLHDMAGNVWEWTSSAYANEYAKPRPTGASAPRVSRGGAWNRSSPQGVRAAYRGGSEPSNRYGGLGFRCAL